MTLAEIKKEYIRQALERTGHNQRAAADLLGIHRQQLARKIRKHRLAVAAFRRGRPDKPNPTLETPP